MSNIPEQVSNHGPQSPHELKATEYIEQSATTRCGVVAVIGKPNVGKSTLMNALLGAHLSITSSKPQTTRHRVLGVLTAQDLDVPTQFVFVDTPGFQTRHSNALNRHMNRSVLTALGDVNAVLWLSDRGRVLPADKQVLDLCPKHVPVIAVLSKIDLSERKTDLLPIIQSLSSLRDFAAIVPVSSQKGIQLDVLKAAIAKLLPEQAFFYESDMLTDRPERFIAAERLREKLFRLTGDELPYASTVVIDKYEEFPNRRVIYASIVVDRASHKAMIIGQKGEKLKRIATEARTDLEEFLGVKVHLETWVKVRSGWADDASVLQSLGFQ